MVHFNRCWPQWPYRLGKFHKMSLQKIVLYLQTLLVACQIGCNIEFRQGPKFTDGGIKRLSSFLEQHYNIDGAEVSPNDQVYDEDELPIIILNPEFDGELRLPSKEELQPIVDTLSELIVVMSKYLVIGVGVKSLVSDTIFYQYYKFTNPKRVE